MNALTASIALRTLLVGSMLHYNVRRLHTKRRWIVAYRLPPLGSTNVDCGRISRVLGQGKGGVWTRVEVDLDEGRVQ